MNNTKTTTLALVAVFMAATLVVGTIAATAITTQTAFAAPQKKPGHGDKKTRDNDGSGNGNGNTVTIEECKNRGSASGFDTALDQECENLICTHPGNNATCVQEGVTSTTPTPTTIQVSGQGEGENFCPRATQSLPASITFSAQQSGSAAVQGQFTVTVAADGDQLIKTGTLNDLQISGNTFTLTGTELSQGPVTCGNTNPPVSATITGQCGTGVTIQYATADGEHATFTGNVVCTTT